MKYGTVVHVSQLRVGDVVRSLHGMVRRTPGSAPVLMVDANGDQTGTPVESTRGFSAPEVGAPEDFRQGYDAMTVYAVTDEAVSFARPFFHVYDGDVNQGVERVDNVSLQGGHWYELLSTRTKAK